MRRGLPTVDLCFLSSFREINFGNRWIYFFQHFFFSLFSFVNCNYLSFEVTFNFFGKLSPTPVGLRWLLLKLFWVTHLATKSSVKLAKSLIQQYNIYELLNQLNVGLYEHIAFTCDNCYGDICLGNICPCYNIFIRRMTLDIFQL